MKIRFRLREISAILGLDQFRCKRSISDTTVLIVLIVLIYGTVYYCTDVLVDLQVLVVLY